jgi:hypothetical protein
MEGKTILINSKDRLSGTTSDFSFIIPPDGDIIYTHAIVLGCDIPLSYYLVDSPYNTFILRENLVDTVITVHEGNYNVNSFQDVLTILLNTLSPNLWNYTISFNNDYNKQANGLYTFTCTNWVTNPPSFIFNTQTELYTQFGFQYNTTNTFNSSGVLISNNVVSFIPQTVLTISSDICRNRNLLTIFHGNASPYSQISYQCTTDLYSKRLSNEAKDGIYHFSLLSKNGHSINLNGLSMVMNLLLYKENTKYQQDISDYIRYKLLSNK